MSSKQRPLVVSVERLHRITQRREETKIARYDVLVGSVSRVITRAVSMDPSRTSMFISLGMLMGRELTSPGIDVPTGIEYVCLVLRRNGFTVAHIGEGVLLVSWPSAPKTPRLAQMEECDTLGNGMPARERPTKNYAAAAPHIQAAPIHASGTSTGAAPSAQQVAAAQGTLSNIRRIVAKYKNI